MMLWSAWTRLSDVVFRVHDTNLCLMMLLLYVGALEK